MQGSIRRPRIQVYWTDLADMPLTFPPTPDDVATIVGTTLDVGSASPGQVLSWDGSVFEWISAGGGSPGGADTQIQFNNAGAFGGSAKMTFDGTDLTFAFPNSVISLGDQAGAYNGVSIVISDAAQLITMTGDVTMSWSSQKAILGADVRFGDTNNDSGNGYYSGIRIVVADSTIYALTPSGVAHIGDFDGRGNGTLLTVDDANERATFNKKAVITDTGAFYIYDAGTSTYWKWESISGTWTGTDTGSASLP